MKSAVSFDDMTARTRDGSRIGDFKVEKETRLNSVSLRERIFNKLCEEVNAGRLNSVNSFLEPYGLSVNPEFLTKRSGKLLIMKDIEIALNELDDDAFSLNAVAA